MAPQGKPKVIRPMSNLELYHSALHTLRHSCGTAVTCRYVLPGRLIGGTVENAQDAFRMAVALTVIEHPMLQVGILNEDSAMPSWIELERIDLGTHVTWEKIQQPKDYDVSLKKAIGSQLDTWFTDVESKPGWRMSVLYLEGPLASLDVIFCWNHTNCDGVAGKIFHQSLLRNLNDPKVGKKLDSLKDNVLILESVADRFPPPPEKLIKIPISWGFALSTIWKELRPPFLVSSDPTQVNWAPIHEEPYRTVFKTISIDDATLKRVVEKCRAHKTTIAGLLHALPLASLSLQLAEGQKHHKNEAKSMYAITALDVRRFIPAESDAYPWHVPSTTMDNQMALCDHMFDENMVSELRTRAQGVSSDEDVMTKLEDIVWSAAAQARKDIQHKVDQGMNNDPLGLMGLVKDWRIQKKQQLKKPRVGAWGVSNLGTMDGEVEGSGSGSGWKIERAVFQLSCEITSPVFHISSMSVKGKELCVDISWQEGVIDAEIGNKLASDMEAWLRFLGA
ncbi:alcohol acetyltransferase-domain-containing protein [Fusarium venenatum]|uniref:alcohol acetyltransferase-domain-containing protein n=1 Tax=Fusarium venenatum TaxID=56646 RepID=UPI001D295BE0|nr:alcohol acetyltransferase-domain-containing protein [Fusarium venenatum]